MPTDFHTADNCAAVQFKFAAVDGHFALNLSVAGAVGQRQRRAAADLDAAVDRLPVQAEVDLAFWHSPAARHRLRQIIAARRIGQGIGSCPLCASSVMFVPVDISIPAADAVGMNAGLCVRIVPSVFILAALGRIRFAVLSATGVRGTGILLATLCAVLFLIRSALLRYRSYAALRRVRLFRPCGGDGQERQAQRQRHEHTQYSFFHIFPP